MENRESVWVQATDINERNNLNVKTDNIKADKESKTQSIAFIYLEKAFGNGNWEILLKGYAEQESIVTREDESTLHTKVERDRPIS